VRVEAEQSMMTDEVKAMRKTAVGRAGQTLVVALSVMFLLFFIGALFVAMIARNLNRVGQAGDRTSAQALAESGLNWVNTQLTYSDLGADWRPSPTWPTPVAAAGEALRRRDPDYYWLSDGGSYRKPWTRILSGVGRFLIRVDYEPSYRSTVERDPVTFDPLSSNLHIKAVGRPGRLEDDPTLLVAQGSPYEAPVIGKPKQILGAYHELEGWKPIGLTDQLWWITNKNKERGPAVVGVPPFQDGQGRTVVRTERIEGGFRSNMDVLFQGPTIFDVYPASGEGAYTVGAYRIGEFPRMTGAGQAGETGVAVSLLNEANNSFLLRPVRSSDDPLFDVVQTPNGRGAFLDSLWLADNTVRSERSMQYMEPPALDAAESADGDSRYRRMTRTTGINLKFTEGGVSQIVNTGDYGYGDGIYIDNYNDIQHPENRDAVVDEWLKRGTSDVSQTGWSGSFYTPSVRESGTVHPVLEVELRPEGIRLTRYDRDVRGRNLGADSQYKTRIFYQAVSKTNPNRPPAGPTDIDTNKGLVPVGPTITMPYPPDGVLYAEGSLRIRGTIGRNPLPALGEPASASLMPVQLTVVSGGSIYIEGSILKAHPASRLALLARDYVCLNPTQFAAVRPYEDVTIEPDGAGSRSFHYSVPQEKDLDLIFSSSAPIEGQGMLLNLQHTAGFSDNSSNTSVSMYVNGLDVNHRYDFQANAVKPSFPPGGGQAVGGNPYQFQFFPPPTDPLWWKNSWGVTNFQSSSASTVNYERKSFWIPKDLLRTGAGEENRFRFHVDSTPNGQPWWLAGASLIPYHKPLDVEVEAVIYAQNGSWFVVPTTWFNDNPLDSRQLFRSGDSSTSRSAGSRAYGTFPADSDDFPFFREPLNVQVTVRGSITEGTTVDGSVRSQWVKKMTMEYTDPQSKQEVRQILGLPDWYQPNLRYVYDQDLRDWVRYRNVVTGIEGIAYTGPVNANPTAARLTAIQNTAMQNGQNIVTLPILPRLPTSGTLFRGRPL
jgi:hypothetical protein